MMTAEPFPLFYPGDARRPFISDASCRRLVRLAQWTGGSRLLTLGASPAVLAFAKEHGCRVMVADSDEAQLEALRERARGLGVGDLVETRRVDFTRALPFEEGQFDGILSLGFVPMPIRRLVELRSLLALKGRLVVTYPVRVGRNPLKVALDFWEKKLSESLLGPTELLQAIERGQFEPESIESLADSELDDFYHEVEPLLVKLGGSYEVQAELLKEEIELHRAQSGKSSVTFALAVGRRREEGERPPPSRDAG